MSRGRTVMIGVLIAMGVVALGVWRLWWSPRAELEERITFLQRGVAGLQSGLEDEFEVRDRLAAFAETTLGTDADLVQHRFRKLLGEIATESGLGNIVVSDRPFRARTNPAVEARTRELSDFRGSVDVYELEATLAGVGRLDSVLECLAAVESQGWVHRVRGVSLKPLGRDRAVVEMRIEVSTYFANDLGPATEPVVAEASAESIGRLAGLWERDLFRPAPVVVAREPEPEAPVVREAPKPKFGEWQVVGVTRAAEGPRVLVKSVRSGRTRTLAPGESILGLVFEGPTARGAAFREGEVRLEVPLGLGLDRRVPLSG